MADKKVQMKDIRNMGIIAHIDANKTTTTEGILYRTGLKHKIGAVHEGETTTDWMAQERERGALPSYPPLSLVTGRVSKSTLLTPQATLTLRQEVERSLRVLDGACVRCRRQMGGVAVRNRLAPGRQVRRAPRICFINKINQTGGDFYKSFESIHNRLSKRAFQSPANWL